MHYQQTTVPTIKFMKHTGRLTPKQGLACLFYVNMYMIGLMQCPNGWRNGCYSSGLLLLNLWMAPHFVLFVTTHWYLTFPSF